jgi:hypothetical protein
MFSLNNFKYQTGEQLISNFVLKPLFEAYSKMKNEDKCLANYDENTITKKIVWHLKYETSLAYFCERRLVAVVMRPMEQETISQVYEPDIKVFIWNYLWFEIEAKRMYEGNGWTTSEYIGNDGLGRFISNRYSKDEKYASMIGYIQNGDLVKIIQSIKNEIVNKNFKKWLDFNGIENCILSLHYRSDNDDIEMFHVFFHFSQSV